MCSSRYTERTNERMCGCDEDRCMYIVSIRVSERERCKEYKSHHTHTCRVELSWTEYTSEWVSEWASAGERGRAKRQERVHVCMYGRVGWRIYEKGYGMVEEYERHLPRRSNYALSNVHFVQATEAPCRRGALHGCRDDSAQDRTTAAIRTTRLFILHRTVKKIDIWPLVNGCTILSLCCTTYAVFFCNGINMFVTRSYFL